MSPSESHKIHNVALAGATGNIGSLILSALLRADAFAITVLVRSASPTPVFPASVTVKPVDYTSVESLAAALSGADAIVSALSRAAVPLQHNLIRAARAAGVRRFLPSEYGADTTNHRARAMPTYRAKIAVQDFLEEEAHASGGRLTYTYVFNNVLLDWGLQEGLLLDWKERKAVVYDGGVRPFSTARMETVAKAVVSVLRREEATRNRAVYVRDAAVTQRLLLEMARAATPGQEWMVEERKTEELEAKARAEMESGRPALEVFHSFAVRAAFGVGFGGNFEHVDNELLGIEEVGDRELEEIVVNIVKQMVQRR